MNWRVALTSSNVGFPVSIRSLSTRDKDELRPPLGFVFLVDQGGAYLTDSAGAFLIGAA